MNFIISESLIFLIIIILPYSGNSQPFTIFGDRTYGGDHSEFAEYIIQGSGYEFIAVGTTVTNIFGDKTVPKCDTNSTDGDIWVVKVDSVLNIIWQRNIGSTESDGVSHVTKNYLSNQYLVACTSISDSACDKSQNAVGQSDYWIVALDSAGNTLWDKTYGGLDIESDSKVVQLSTGEYIISGGSRSQISGDKTVNNYGGRDMWVIKVDSIGNQIWDNVYGGTSQEYTASGSDLIETGNGSFIVACQTISPVSGNISEPPRGNTDIWIVKIDSSGNKIWDKRFGGSGLDFIGKIVRTDDNGYIISGNTSSPMDGDVTEPPIGTLDVWIMKIDSLGNKMWDKRYGGTEGESLSSIVQDYDGGYIVFSGTRSPVSGHITEPPIGNVFDYWVFKIDSVGNKLWDKRFGSPGNNQARNLILYPDSSILLFGNADTGITATKTYFGNGGYDYWVVHFKHNNNTIGVDEYSNFESSFSIAPNPTNSTITVNYMLPKNEEGILELFDASGKVIIRRELPLYSTSQRITLPIEISSGVYACVISTSSFRASKNLVVHNK